MRRKLVNGMNRVIRFFVQATKRARIRLLYSNILVDSSTYIGHSVKLYALRGAVLDIRGVYIRDFAHLYADTNARLIINRGAQVGMFNVIVCKGSIVIGNNTLIAEHVTIRDQDHDLLDLNKMHISPVQIGNNCWIASKVTVKRGVTIGDNTVVGAHSMVTKNLPAGVLALGTPAKVVRDLNEDELNLAAQKKVDG